MWTDKFDLNTDTCGHGNFLICKEKKYPDTSGRGLKVRSHCHFNKVSQRHSCDNSKKICQKVRCTFRCFFPVYQSKLLNAFFIFSFHSSSSWLLQRAGSVKRQTTLDMRRFRWKADDLMGKGRRKRRLRLLASREARIWKQLNLLSWMLATILTKYYGSFAFKNPSSELELCV